MSESNFNGASIPDITVTPNTETVDDKGVTQIEEPVTPVDNNDTIENDKGTNENNISNVNNENNISNVNEYDSVKSESNNVLINENQNNNQYNSAHDYDTKDNETNADDAKENDNDNPEKEQEGENMSNRMNDNDNEIEKNASIAHANNTGSSSSLNSSLLIPRENDEDVSSQTLDGEESEMDDNSSFVSRANSEYNADRRKSGETNRDVVRETSSSTLSKRDKTKSRRGKSGSFGGKMSKDTNNSNILSIAELRKLFEAEIAEVKRYYDNEISILHTKIGNLLVNS